MTWLVACELSRWRTAKLSNIQGEFAQETPPTVKSSSWWLISADAKLAPLSEEKTLPQGECKTAFVCCQFEINCPCVLKPGEGNYLLSAKLVITVTRSALRLPVSNPLLQPALAWPVCPSSNAQDEMLNFFDRVHLFILCTLTFMPTKHFICCFLMVTMTFCVWLFLCGQSARTMSGRARAHAHTQTIFIRKRLGAKMPVINDTSPTLHNAILGFHYPSSHCVKVCLWCMEDL